MDNLQYPQYQPNSTAQFNQTEMMMTGPEYTIPPAAELQINQTIAQGFGQFFFNALDPNIAKTNIPIKLGSQMHIPILLGTALMIGGIVAGAIMVKYPDLFNGAIALLVVPYLVYIGISIGCSQIRGYITNLKKFNDYKATYDKMVAGRGYFHFWIECYHYRTVKTKNGTRREKVVTHTATENYFPSFSVDESGNIEGIKDISKYVFIKYLKRFYFSDKASEEKFNAAYNSFINRNRRDCHQNYTQTFEIQGFEEEVGFCMLGDSPHNTIIFYISTFLGLALPYSCILERSVSRYSINILKRLTC